MKQTKIWVVFRWIGIVLVVLVLLVYIGLPAAMGFVTVSSARAAEGSKPAGYEDVAIHTADGVDLQAWYLAPQNGKVVIVVHGAGGNRSGMIPYGEMLARHGYGVLLLDLRGHGVSGGKTNRLGWMGTADISAAVAYLKTRPEVKAIGGLGSSMGAEVLLGAASANPELAAIAADGASRRCMAEYTVLPENRPLAHNFTVGVMYATVGLLSGEKPPLPMLDSIQQAASTRYLFITAGNNALEVSFNQLFSETVPDRSALWIVPGVDHVGAFGRYPDEYEQRVVDFFQSSLKVD